MIFVIGGLSSGKRDYVASEFGFSADDFADGVLDASPVLYNLQDLTVRDPANATSLLPVLLEKKVIICNEIGSGIIPLDKTERLWREETGRLCAALAKNAEKVVRVTCGLPQVIKG